MMQLRLTMKVASVQMGPEEETWRGTSWLPYHPLWRPSFCFFKMGSRCSNMPCKHYQMQPAISIRLLLLTLLTAFLELY